MRPLRLSVAASIAAASMLLLLAGCGGGTQTVVVGTPPATSPPSKSPAAATAPAGATPLHLAAFRSPSGNIGCMIVSSLARCDIEHRAWSPPARPAGCPHVVDFGQGLEIGAAGPPGFVCAGDTVRNPAAAGLPYGSSTSVGPFLCASSRDGITCSRPADGHGFFISIQSYRLF